ncbi:unnamed protein product, partial [marine sediment metagenome]
NELNFQNFDQILQICSLIDFEKCSNKISNEIKEKGDKTIKEAVSEMAKQIAKKGLDIKKAETQLPVAQLVVKSFFSPIVNIDKKNMFVTINYVINLRHKIVHNNINVKISNAYLSVMGFEIAQFVVLIEKILESKYKKNKKVD